WTDRFPAVAEALGRLGLRQALFDGEVAALEPGGTTHFPTLQNALRARPASRLVYFLFDLVHIDGRDLTRVPLVERKELLRAVLAGAPGILRFSDHQIGNGSRFPRRG